MRVVVISCFKYRDTWAPFLALFRKFFGGPIELLTDDIDGRELPSWVTLNIQKGSWCQMLAQAAKSSAEPFLLLQDDFFINEHVRHDLIDAAYRLVNDPVENIGCVRIYPCPGSDRDDADHYGIVPRGTPYRISCQAAIWRPDYIAQIASRFNTPAEFEIEGTKLSNDMYGEVLAFRRELTPWPIEYICSAISRGQWNPDAKALCDWHDIPIDLSMRPMAAA